MKSFIRTGPVLFVLAASVFLLLTPPERAVAQDMAPEIGEFSQVQDYGRPGYPRVKVFLWGNGSPGAWTVEENTDLLEFLSVAAQGDFNQPAETRVKNMLRMYRKGQTNEEPVFEAKLDRMFSRQMEYPTLRNGDVLVVESIQRRKFFTFRNISRVTGTAASIASLIVLITR